MIPFLRYISIFSVKMVSFLWSNRPYFSDIFYLCDVNVFNCSKMKKIYLMINRRHTGASPETFRLWLNALTVTAFLFLHQKLFNEVNAKSQFRIHGCGNPNSSWDTETRGESELLQGTIPAKFGF